MSRFAAAPEAYWHCYFGKDGDTSRRLAKVFDLTKESLQKQILKPWHEGRSFSVGGKVIKNRDAVSTALVVHTDRASAEIEAEVDARLNQYAAADGVFVTSDQMEPFREGTDFTQELLFENPTTSAPPADVALLLRLCAPSARGEGSG